MNTTQLIAHLNAMKMGEMASLQDKLGQARQACEALEQSDLADKLNQASTALNQADVQTYRRLVATVVARLGHLR